MKWLAVLGGPNSAEYLLKISVLESKISAEGTHVGTHVGTHAEKHEGDEEGGTLRETLQRPGIIIRNPVYYTSCYNSIAIPDGCLRVN